MTDKYYCPACGNKLKTRGSKKRLMIDGKGDVIEFRLRRLFCSSCNSTNIELPDIMLPNKHYAADVIEKVKNGIDDDFVGDDITIRRWKKEK